MARAACHEPFLQMKIGARSHPNRCGCGTLGRSKTIF
jgi:hypothetical protein